MRRLGLFPILVMSLVVYGGGGSSSSSSGPSYNGQKSAAAVTTQGSAVPFAAATDDGANFSLRGGPFGYMGPQRTLGPPQPGEPWETEGNCEGGGTLTRIWDYGDVEDTDVDTYIYYEFCHTELTDGNIYNGTKVDTDV